MEKKKGRVLMHLQPVTFNVMNTMYPAHYRCTLIPTDRVVANGEWVMCRQRCGGGGRNLVVCFRLKVSESIASVYN